MVWICGAQGSLQTSYTVFADLGLGELFNGHCTTEWTAQHSLTTKCNTSSATNKSKASAGPCRKGRWFIDKTKEGPAPGG